MIDIDKLIKEIFKDDPDHPEWIEYARAIMKGYLSVPRARDFKITDIISVQPMDSPVGLIFKKDWIYEDKKESDK